MMTTDSERREMARRLRHAWVNVPDTNRVRHHLRVLYEIYEAIGVSGDRRDAIDLFDRLADLIEPDDPPYNLYTLYEAVFHRSPRCWECVEDDEVDELVDALLDICNSPGHERIQRPQPSEPKVRCVAEVKVDGERLEELAHEAAVELTGIDRDALLALAEECDEMRDDGCPIGSYELYHIARRIREALEVQDA